MELIAAFAAGFALCLVAVLVGLAANPRTEASAAAALLKALRAQGQEWERLCRERVIVAPEQDMERRALEAEAAKSNRVYAPSIQAAEPVHRFEVTGGPQNDTTG